MPHADATTTNLLQQLAAHRATLQTLLAQRAGLGSLHAPPGIHGGIAQARAAIAQLKADLSARGVDADDQPGDVAGPGEALMPGPNGLPARAARALWSINALLALVAMLGAGLLARGLLRITAGDYGQYARVCSIGGLGLLLGVALYLAMGWWGRGMRFWLASAAAVALLGGCGALVYALSRPPAKTIVLVAQYFQEKPEFANFSINGELHKQLAAAFANTPEIELVELDEAFAETERATALQRGHDYRASIMIWGAYDEKAEAARVSSYIEPLCLTCPPNLPPSARGDDRDIKGSAITGTYTGEDQIAAEMIFLSRFTLGLAHRQAQDAAGSAAILAAIERDPALASMPASFQSTFYRYTAYALQDTNQYGASLPVLDKAVQADPASSLVFSARGYSHAQLGQYAQAADDFKRSLELNGEEQCRYIGWHYADALYRQGDYQGALDAYVASARLNSGHWMLWQSMGHAYEGLGNLPKAVEALEKSIGIDPNQADVYADLGRVAAAQGNTQQAIKRYGQAIERDPKNAEYLGLRAELYAKAGQGAQAIGDRQLIVQLAPASASAWINLGVELHNAAKYADAILAYNRAYTLDSTQTVILIDLANAYLAQADYPNALANFDKALAREPGSADYHYRRGIARQSAGDQAGAIQDYEQALARDPTLPGLAFDLAMAYYTSQRYADARDQFGAAIDTSYEPAISHRNRGLCYAQLGDYTSAIADAREAARLNPAFADAWNDLGRYYAATDDPKAARESYEQALKVAQNDAARKKAQAGLDALPR